jgi:hypothetical protein
MGRPQFFTIDQSHQLAKGLVFAGLGHAPGSLRYNDSSRALNHGTLTNMTPSQDWVWSNELGRWCVNFAGSANRISIPTSLGTTWSSGVFTTAAWAMWDSLTGDHGIISNDGNAPYSFALFSHVTNVYAIRNSANIVGPVSVSTSVWTHIAVVRDGTYWSLYKNGVLAAGPTSGGAPSETSVEVGIGYEYRSGQGADFDGKLADVVIASSAFSAAQIAILANRFDPMLSGLIRPIGEDSNIYDREGVR